jgi:hypothetical protein
MSKHCCTELLVVALAFFSSGSAPVQAQQVEPPERVRPAEGEVDEAVVRQLLAWQKSRNALHELQQKAFEAEIRQESQEFIDRLRSEMKKREAEALRRQGLHRLINAVAFLALAAFFGIYLVVQLRKRLKGSAAKPPRPVR